MRLPAHLTEHGTFALGEKQGNAKSRRFGVRVFEPPATCFHAVFDDGQAEPRAAGMRQGRLAPVEGLQQQGQILFGRARPPVADRNAHFPMLLAHFHDDGPASPA